MDENTLNCYLEKFVSSNVKQCAVLAADELEAVNLTKLPIAIIQNSDKRSKKGQHWFSYFIYKHPASRDIVAEVFDSYALQPKDYGISVPFRIVKKLNYDIQSNDSANCGKFAFFFLNFRARGFSFEDIASQFSKNKQLNDERVVNYFKFLKKVEVESGGQSCCCKSNF